MCAWGWPAVGAWGTEVDARDGAGSPLVYPPMLGDDCLAFKSIIHLYYSKYFNITVISGFI